MTENRTLSPGQYFDAESGLHYNYFRNYDSKIGRYREPDPIGLTGGMNRYLYADANPINKTDIKGLAPLPFLLDFRVPDCSYYYKRGKEAGGLYYPYIAPFICETWPDWIAPTWSECVRQCLKDYDNKYCNDPCKKGMDISCTISAHTFCFTGCASNNRQHSPLIPYDKPQN